MAELSDADAAALRAGPEGATVDIDAIARGIRGVLVGAYDGGGFVAWEPGA